MYSSRSTCTSTCTRVPSPISTRTSRKERFPSICGGTISLSEKVTDVKALLPSRFKIALMKFKVSVFRSSEPNRALKNTSLRRFKWIISGISDVGIVITSPLILSLACCNVNQDHPVKGQESILTIIFMIITPVSYHFSKCLPSASIFKQQGVSTVNGRSPSGKLLDGWHFLLLPWPCEGCFFPFLLRLIKT